MILNYDNDFLLADKVEFITKYDSTGDELYSDTYNIVLVACGKRYTYEYKTEEERDNIYNTIKNYITKNHNIIDIKEKN